MDGSKRIIGEQPALTTTPNETPVVLEQKEWTDERIDSWLSEQTQAARKTISAFEAQARQDFARVEMSLGTSIDQPTNNRILALLNDAERAYKTLSTRIETIQKDRAEKIALKKLHEEIRQMQWSDPVQAIKLLLSNTDRIRAIPENTTGTSRESFEELEMNLLCDSASRVIENYYQIQDPSEKIKQGIELHQLYSSIGPEHLLHPQNIKHVSHKIHELHGSLFRMLEQQLPDEQDRNEYIKKHNVDDLLFHTKLTPEERSALVNTCVKKGIGRQMILYGERRMIIPHLEDLNPETLSEDAKTQIFDDLIAVSIDPKQNDNWAVCLWLFPELFLKNMKDMSLEQKNILEASLNGLYIKEAKIAQNLIHIKNETGLSLEALPNESRITGFFSLAKAGESTEEWEKQFNQFPDITNVFNAEFNTLRYSEHSLRPEFAKLVFDIPEKHRRNIPTKILSEALGYLLVHKDTTDGKIEHLCTYPIDWGLIMTIFLKSTSLYDLKKSEKERTSLFPETVQTELKKHPDQIFESIFKGIIDHSLNRNITIHIDYFQKMIGTPDVRQLVQNVALYAEQKSIETDPTTLNRKLLQFVEVFDGLSEDYEQARDEELDRIGRHKILALAIKEKNNTLIKRFGDTPEMNWNEFFATCSQDQKIDYLTKLVREDFHFSESTITQIKPILLENKDALLHQNSIDDVSLVDVFRKIHLITPLTPSDFEPFIARIAEYSHQQALQDLLETFKHEQKLLQRGLKNNIDLIFARSIITKNKRILNASNSFLKNINWKEVGLKISQNINIIDLLQAMKTYPALQPHIPWALSLEQLKTKQPISRNKIHCPWNTELIPLLKHATTEKLVSMDKTEDGEHFTTFIQEFGAFNLPKIFELFLAFKRKTSINELSEQHKKWIVDCLGKQAFKKAQNPEIILNELKKFKRDLQSSVLSDEIPQGLMSELGQEIFSAIRGSTSWKRHDQFENLIETWKKYKIENPEKAVVPREYKQITFEITMIENSNALSQKQQAQKEKLLENKELQITLQRIINTYRNGIQITDLSVWWKEKQKMITEKWQSDLEKTLIKQLQSTSDVARNSMQKNIDRLQTQINGLLAIQTPTETTEQSITAFLETIASVKKEELESALQELSAFHINLVAIGDWANNINEIIQETEVNPLTIVSISDFLTQYVKEHYLSKEQENHDHSQHTPFSPELTNTLLSVWQLKGDVKKHPVIQSAEKLRALDENFINEEADEQLQGQMLDEKLPVTFVPAKGLMRIFAGDVGDACYTSRYAELASGQHEDLTSILMVTNKGKSDERIEGSVLFIESKTTDGEDILIVRANNPRENLLGKVHSDSLIQATLLYAQEIAQNCGFSKTGIVLDQKGAASSNRGTVADYYQAKYAHAPKLALKYTQETNFNGYNISDPIFGHPVVEI